jgi:AAA family ATP:ADP antiporter
LATAPAPAPLPPGAILATIASASMIAQQVAGKAARDAMFLSNFSVTTLPIVMATAAVLSLGVVIGLSRLIMRHSPARVMPALFALSVVALLAEWVVSFRAPRVAALALYLHTALFGAVLISAFWSLINEKFDPHAGKRAVSVIAGGGTLGGVVGGIIAWRAAAVITVPTMLPLLAAINLVGLWSTVRLRDPPVKGRRRVQAEVVEAPAKDTPTPWRMLRDAPYLRNLSIIVFLGAVTSGLLDYVFSAEVAKAIAKGPALLSFFSLFWLVVGVLTFASQALLGRVALEKLGLAATVGILPGVVVLGGAFGLAVPGLLSTSLLRGAEAIQRNSLYRSAYELLYTPLSEQKKRSTKTFIDVGLDRIGTAAAGGIALLTLQLDPARAGGILLCVAVACAVILLARSRPLHKGYVGELEASLSQEAEKTAIRADTPDPEARPTQERIDLRDKIIAQLDDLPHRADLAAIATEELSEAPEREGRAKDAVEARLHAALSVVGELCAGDVARARRVLRADAPLDAAAVAFAILLLANQELHQDAIRALRKVALPCTGQLVDALCNPDMAFDIRRRIPRVLSASTTQEAANGLLRGTEDARFEVRYACGRALLRMTGANPEIVVELERLIVIVKREVELSKEVWESQTTQFEDEDDERPALIDRLLRDRIDRSLEHVFTILAIHIDRESLRIAFKALHEEESHLRGTALEYLETVLPDEVRDAVWPFLGEDRPMRPARPAKDILADLVAHR